MGRSTLEYNLTTLRFPEHTSVFCAARRVPASVIRAEMSLVRRTCFFLRNREEFFGDALRAELINSIVKNCAVESPTSGNGR